MPVRTWGTALVGHRMRAYYLAVAAGLGLVASAFMPRVVVGDVRLGGVPDVAGLSILGLGLLAVLLSSLSIVTRRNSRHPLLLVGLTAFGILVLGEQLTERAAADQAWVHSEAVAIVHDINTPAAPRAAPGLGAYVGLVAATTLIVFGLTIVIRRVARPYAEPHDDDV